MSTRKHKKKKKTAKPKLPLIVPRSASALAPPLKGQGGYSIGDLLEKGLDAVAHLFGIGSYEVKTNSLYTGSSDMPNAQLPEFEAPVIRIKHKEFLGNILSSEEFSSSKFVINPGLYATFPWLSGIAPHFTTYRVHGMVFGFLSRSATAIGSTSTALGTVILATQYESTEPEFVDQKAMEAHKYVSAGKPSESFFHPVECDFKISGNVVDKLYVRTSEPTDTELLYDKGYLQVATVGQQASGQNLGELWCAYDVELFIPSLPASGSLTPVLSIYTSQTTSATMKALTNYDPTLFCNVNQLGAIVDATAQTITLPRPGTYFLLYTLYYSGGTAGAKSMGVDVTGTDSVLFTISAGSPVAAVGNNGTDQYWEIRGFETTTPNQTINMYSLNGTSGTATSAAQRIVLVHFPTIPSPLSTTLPSVMSLNSRIEFLEQLFTAQNKGLIPKQINKEIDIYESKLTASDVNRYTIDMIKAKLCRLPDEAKPKYAADAQSFLVKLGVSPPLLSYFVENFMPYLTPVPSTTASVSDGAIASILRYIKPT